MRRRAVWAIVAALAALALVGFPALAQEINVQGNGQDIANGDTTPTEADHTDFGATPVDGGTIQRTFTIQNVGDAPLDLEGDKVTLTGLNADDFSVSQEPGTSTIQTGGSTTFEITFDPSAEGDRTATVNIDSNDPDDDPYTFAILGTGLVPDINVQGNGQDIGNGDTTPSAADHTDFGETDASGGLVERTFTIHNTGEAPLNLEGARVTITGANAGDFTVTRQPTTPVAVGGATTFDVLFDPHDGGERIATISIDSNDPDEDPYTFDVRGVGLVSPAGGSGSNHAPTADAGPDQRAPLGTTVTVDGTSSYDPDNGTAALTARSAGRVAPSSLAGLSFEWEFTVLYYDAGVPVLMVPEGSQVASTATGFDTPVGTFVPDLVGEYVLTLTVSDAQGAWAVDQVTITVYLDPSYVPDDEPGLDPEPQPQPDASLGPFVVFPNPFSSDATFQFRGSAVPELFWVSVYDLSGRLVWEASDADVTEIHWDGSDHDGNALAEGPYVYVAYLVGGSSSSAYRGTIFLRR